MSYEILTTKNFKTDKSVSKGWATAGVHFAPSTLSGHNVCPMASEGCKLACLNVSGHGQSHRVQDSRLKKTKEFFDNRENFMMRLIGELSVFVRRSEKNGLKPAVRLNLTSDVVWESLKVAGKTIFDIFPNVQFYDYTKIPKRFFSKLPANYHLTFSRSESNGAQAEMLLKLGHNVAVVFETLPKSYLGREVVSGDETDLRFLDKKGVVVGLTPKARAKKDVSGFVVRA